MISEINVKVKKLSQDSKIPFYATEEAAGCDFYSAEDRIIMPGDVAKIPSGIAMEIPNGYFMHIVSRSGLAVKGINKIGGILDSDYRGEIHLLLHNTTKEKFEIEKGQRIAQGLLMPIYRAKFEEVSELSETKRGSGGFHSTGKN
jgi:dUTP pyrophosphatase